MKIDKLMLLLFLLCGCYSGYGQERKFADTLNLRVYFRYGISAVDLEFRDNAGRLETFENLIHQLRADTSAHVTRIDIRSGASPEGNSDAQKRLASYRGLQVATELEHRIGLPSTIMHLESVGIDWEGLYDLVAASGMPFRDQALTILRDTPEWITRNGQVVDGRKRQLQMLAGGRVWNYMSERFFAQLRQARVKITGYHLISPPSPPVRDTVVVSRRDTVVVVHRDTVVISHRDTVVLDCRKSGRPLRMSLKTNLIYDVALVPNVGAEFYLGRGWSLGGSWMYAWWNSDRRHRYWRTYGGELNLRKYFGRRASEKPLAGHHLGLYGQMLTYDFETGGTGYQSKLSYGGGIEYGYSLPVGRRLNLDFSVGVGYLGGEYKKYDPEDGHYVWKETRRRHWFGPTKAEVSLIWLIGRGNSNEKKGGKR